MSHDRGEEPGGGSIGATTRGLGAGVEWVLIALYALGLLAAVIGAVRGERPIWVHGVGILLTVSAPVLGIAMLRAWFG